MTEIEERAKKIDLGLTGYDELFMNDAERKENKLPRIYDVPISEIDDFPDHPFKVKLMRIWISLFRALKSAGLSRLSTSPEGKMDGTKSYPDIAERRLNELAGLDTVKAEVQGK